jgi:ATP-dependent DNA helicase RecG
MPAAFEKLSKILTLEQSQEYRNRAVIGGLVKFAGIWQEEALAEIQEQAQADQVEQVVDLLAHYEEADRDRRAQIVGEVLSVLGSTQEAAGTRQPPLQKPGTTPASSPPLQKPGTESPAPPPLHKPGTEPAPRPPAQKPGSATGGLQTVPPSPQPKRPDSGLDAPVTNLPGISTAYAARLRRLGIVTVGDVLYHFPHRYDDYRTLKAINQLTYGEETTIVGTIWETRSRQTRGGRSIVTSVIADASGTIEAVWFNQPYLTRQLRAGRRIVLSGKVDEYLGHLTLTSPTWEPLDRELIHTGRLVPIYPLTHGISSRWMRRLTKRVVDHWVPRLRDPLPADVRERAGLIDLPTAVRQIHFPANQEAAQQARDRLSFDEFLLIQLGMLSQRREWQNQQGVSLPRQQALVDRFLESLPFQLTPAQLRSLDQILDDLTRAQPMSRLLEGDVGSGKTVVATAAMLTVVAAGKQVALMAPTEILAEQHYRTVAGLLTEDGDWGLERPISASLLTGSLRRVERRKVYTAIASGETDIVVGTHALIQRHVTFRDLGLVIVDEQHRFGVLQRGELRSKGEVPHMLVMSATPIPRSLALTVYGDLDISVIDELPPGRQPIETRWLLPRERERAYAFLRKQIEQGRQAFVLYPLIEESDKVEARAAVEEYERLQEKVFADLRLGLLHGRMKGREKDRIMSHFRQGEIDILISTSVIEVGIDVPNATVMLIEGADRFGLAQLHQFRGRVGRGGHKSYCLLISDQASPDDPQTKATWERLKAIEETQDGFVLAEKDLDLRGPGDFFGVRQSGLPTLRLASLSNVKILEKARSEAQAIFGEDPTLSKPEHQQLAQQVAEFWHTYGEPS